MITDNILTHAQARALIQPFYNLFTYNQRDWDAGMAVLDDNWKAYYTNENFRTKAQTREFLSNFFNLIPDISVEIINLYVDNDTIAVRSKLSGTPSGDFLVPYTGRSFKIMTIDINHYCGNKLTALYHSEDWQTAINQLQGKE